MKNGEAVKNLRSEFVSLIDAQNETISAGLSEMDYLSALKLELDGLVDANGKIQEGYEKRAEFIISKLSTATGIEISAVDGLITGYDSLGAAIDDAIAKKRAMIILEAKEETYKAAIQNLNDLEQAYLEHMPMYKKPMNN